MRATWICVQGAGRDEVLAALQLEVLPEGAAGGWYEGDYSCRAFPGGWLVVASQGGLDLASDLASAAAATQQLALGAEMSTIVMVSESCGYQDGQRQWSIIHDPEDEDDPLAIEGEPPAIVAELKAKALEDPDDDGGADIVFEAPMQVIAHYTGFVYDEDDATDWVPLRATAARPVARDRPQQPRPPGPPAQSERPKPNLLSFLALAIAAIILVGWGVETILRLVF